jgi:N-acyl-D-aspartate/D-glutamate deacylase
MVNGALTMMKPNFSQMTHQDLRAYVLDHRDDDDAIEALIKRRNPNSPKYRFPKTDEDLTEMEKILKEKLDASGEAV